ncbi:hypothetical protein [Paludisphaera rhizosphaerae]|uniref:hypothetical protein n=1 Tax=Paludisphaera rhizosphaerae TaxID=2711216 RepID=UPI0013ED6F64|nr:hypothetical protein [Paludisphaera rhizosphaerae]
MHNPQVRREYRGLLAALLVAASALFTGCSDNSSGTAPVESDAEIQKRQADEQAARQAAYGKSGVPVGRNPGKAAAKAAHTGGTAEKSH